MNLLLGQMFFETWTESSDDAVPNFFHASLDYGGNPLSPYVVNTLFVNPPAALEFKGMANLVLGVILPLLKIDLPCPYTELNRLKEY
jgi:hypothetical protein